MQSILISGRAYVTIADLNEEMGKTYAAELGSKGLKCVLSPPHTD